MRISITSFAKSLTDPVKALTNLNVNVTSSVTFVVPTLLTSSLG